MKLSRRWVAVSSCAVLLGGCLTVRLPKVEIERASEPKVLTWKSAVEKTLEKNPDLINARYAITSSKWNRNQAAGNYLPSVTGSLDRDVSRTTNTISMKDSVQASITGDQPLFTGFDTTGKFIQASKDLEVSRLAYREVSANVRFQLRSVYIELLRLERLLVVSRRIEERRKQNAELINLLYQSGREHLGSAMRARAISEEAAFEVRQTIRRMESQSLLMGQEIGGEFSLPVRVEGDLEKMTPLLSDAVPDYADIAAGTPHVYKLIKTAESFKAALLSAQAAVWPNVDGTMNYSYAGDRVTRWRDELDLGLRISVPFFNGGKNIAGILKARADYRAAVASAKSAENSAVAQLADAWVQFKDATESVGIQKKFLEAARKRSEIVHSEYTTGLVNYQDFDIAEQDLADSEKAYVQSLADVLTKQANWEFVKGSTLEDILHEAS